MDDLTFTSLLIHTCDIQQATILPSGDESYGHTVPTYTTPAVVQERVMCRLAPLSTDEMVRLGISSTTIGTYGLYVHVASVPPALTMVRGAATHQVVNVRKKADGTLVDAGPFDVTGIINPSAMGHHIKIMLSRVSP